MMTVGLHCRIVGRPGHALGLIKFLDYVCMHAFKNCKDDDIYNFGDVYYGILYAHYLFINKFMRKFHVLSFLIS